MVGVYAMALKKLPEPTGPYQVGFAKYDLIDSYRKELDYPSGRLVPIQVYFPMQEGRHSLYPKLFESRTPPKWEPLDVLVYSWQADISLLNDLNKHPVILLNHGDTVAMTDYAFIAEDLASHGYVVISIQHQLATDAEEPPFWKGRSISKYSRVVDNLLHVFQWLQDNQGPIFHNHIEIKKMGFIGHSMGGNALLLLASRVDNRLKSKNFQTLLPHSDPTDVKEAIIVMDTGGVPYPNRNDFPLFFLLSEEREPDQKENGSLEEMLEVGRQVKYYKGSKHISFMDHGYINPLNPLDPNESYFNGTEDERRSFAHQVRMDIRKFLIEKGIH